MKKVLIKDLVIPKGTIFTDIPDGTTSKHCGSENFSTIIGLTDDTHGEVIYSFDKGVDDKQKVKLKEYFIDVKE